MSYQQKPKYSYDKFDEHRDETPLGKLQQQYWTTKQHVIKKLGKKEDEFVVASDAELDAKLESFESIAHSSEELMKIIDAYQDKLITLSIEEAEMSRFLKSQSTFDTRTRAGKMMSAVAKGQHFASQQRTSLRLPLVRLFNEVDTFRAQAIKDTLLTVRKMEQARTEYRGALLWMRDASAALDPDAGAKLEKFRRVQAQVKRTKARFDRLKCDVIQKIDLLAASRCNMFSHALVNYQHALILFWQKTAKTMGAIADAFKGYQYYEFNIIKDLVEPSKRLAKMINDKEGQSEDKEAKKESEEGPNNKDDEANTESISGDDKLIDVSGSENKTATNQEEKTSQLVEFGEFVGEAADGNGENKRGVEDELNELIDLMTLAEETRLSEQLKELEQLEAEKRLRNNQRDNNNKQSSAAGGASQQQQQPPIVPNTASGLFSFMKKSTSSGVESSPKQDLFEFMSGNSAVSTVSQTPSNVRSTIQELFSNVNDEFEREWQSVFQASAPSGTNGASQASQAHNHPHQQYQSSGMADETSGGTISPSHTDFSLFSSSDTASSHAAAAAAITNLIGADELFSAKQPAPVPSQPANSTSRSGPATNKQNWFDLFAELDPLKNPDAIGKSQNLEEERNC